MPDTSTPPTGTTNTQGLAPWAAPYITDYLSRAQTLANEPTQVYQGPLTSGPSQLQNQAFAGIGGLTVPTGIGQGAYDAGQYGRMAANTQYQPQTMNFLGQSFAPQQQQQYTPQPTKQAPIGYPTGGVKGPLGGGGGSYDGSGINPGGMYNQPMGNGSTQSTGPNGEMTGGMPMGDPMESFAPMYGGYKPGQDPGAIGIGLPKDMQTGGPMEQQPKSAPLTPAQPAQSIAQQYMNPYLQASLDPQLAAAKRAADIQAQSNNAAMTKAGAFGGGRQAILTSEGQRNLGDTMSNITGQGYNTAYDKAMQQFNADQDRQMKEAQFGTTSRLQGLQTGIQGAQTQGQLADTQNKANLSNLNTQMNAGDVQRGITSEGIKADYDEWMRQKDDPYKKAQFQKDMLAGLPVGSMTNSAAGLSGVAGLISAMGGVGALNTALGDANSPLGKLLASLGLGTGTTAPATTGTTP